jgi:hypothetical protein
MGDGMVGIVMAGTSGREPMDLQGVGSEGISLENPHRRGRRLWAPPVVPRTRISAIRTGHVLCSWKGGLGKKDLEDRFPGASRLCSVPAITSVHPNSYSFGDGEQDKKKKLEEFMKMPIGYSAPDFFVDLARFGMGYGLH